MSIQTQPKTPSEILGDLQLERYGKLSTKTLYASLENIAAFAVKNSVNTQEKDENGMTLLHFSAKHNWPEKCRFFLNLGSNPNELCNGETILHVAAKNSNVHLLDIAEEYKIDPNIKNADGETALHLFISIGNKSIIKKYFELFNFTLAVNSRKENILHYAALYNCKVTANEMSKRILCRKLLFKRNIDGNTPLKLAVLFNHPEVAEKILLEQQVLKVIKTFIKRKYPAMENGTTTKKIRDDELSNM